MRRQLVSAFVLVYRLITDVYVWLLFKKKKKKCMIPLPVCL